MSPIAIRAPARQAGARGAFASISGTVASLRWLTAAAVLATGVTLAPTTPHAQEGAAFRTDSAKRPQAAAQRLTCQRRPGTLGVSRVVEIDTSAGPKFGLQQYKDNDFLRDREVVLTFDDGPLRRHTRSVLAALASHCTQATFFMVGQMALSDPEMVREVARRGHTIAIHTWSHRNLKSIGSERARKEFELGVSAVQRALGQPVAPFFRFPYLADSKDMLGYLTQRHFAVFSIDSDAYDYRTPNASTVQRNILRSLEANGKGIALFHDIQPSTARALQGLLDTLAKRGFKIVHLVAKHKATSLPNYDEAADREMSRRSRTPVASLARRSIVYPISHADVPVVKYKPVSGTRPPNTGTAAGAGSRTASTRIENGLPPGSNSASQRRRHPRATQSSAPPAPTSAPAPAQQVRRDPEWTQKVFNY